MNQKDEPDLQAASKTIKVPQTIPPAYLFIDQDHDGPSPLPAVRTIMIICAFNASTASCTLLGHRSFYWCRRFLIALADLIHLQILCT